MTDLLAKIERLRELNSSRIYSNDEQLALVLATDVIKLGGELTSEQLELIDRLHAKSLRRVVYPVCICGGHLTESLYCTRCNNFCTKGSFVVVDICNRCGKQPIGGVCDCTITYHPEWLQEGYYV